MRDRIRFEHARIVFVIPKKSQALPFQVKLRQSESALPENGWVKKTDIRQVFGRALQAAMDKRGINQQRLAELSGLSPGHISEARRGISAIGIDRLADLADALQVLPAELLIDDEDVREELIRRVLRGPASEPTKVVAHHRRKKSGPSAKH